VRFDGFEDGVFVTAAEPGLAELVGARVAAMGGCPITEVVEAISAAVPADNPSSARLSSMRLLRLHAVLALLGFTDEDGAVSLSVELPDGQEVTQRLEPAPGVAMPRFGAPADWIDARGDAPRPAWLARAGEDCWFKYREEDRLLYVQFNAVRDPAGEPLARFWERVFAFIDDNLVERLVIDMRHNGGGNNYLNQPLVHGLVRCRELFRPGCVFVITSPRTFSAAVACAANIERETPTLFVGEPTGAGPNHAGDAERFTLPNSGLSLRVSALWWQWSDPRDRRRAIQPDLPAPLTFAVWRAGADPAMEAITAHREREAGELRAPNTNWRRNSQR